MLFTSSTEYLLGTQYTGNKNKYSDIHGYA